jgi:hypothetical protein
MFVHVYFPFVSNRTSLMCLFSISQTSTGAKMHQGKKENLRIIFAYFSKFLPDFSVGSWKGMGSRS